MTKNDPRCLFHFQSTADSSLVVNTPVEWLVQGPLLNIDTTIAPAALATTRLLTALVEPYERLNIMKIATRLAYTADAAPRNSRTRDERNVALLASEPTSGAPRYSVTNDV